MPLFYSYSIILYYRVYSLSDFSDVFFGNLSVHFTFLFPYMLLCFFILRKTFLSLKFYSTEIIVIIYNYLMICTFNTLFYMEKYPFPTFRIACLFYIIRNKYILFINKNISVDNFFCKFKQFRRYLYWMLFHLSLITIHKSNQINQTLLMQRLYWIKKHGI